jgi:hypothetical protein
MEIYYESSVITAIELSKKISEIAREAAFYHRGFLADGDIQTDIEELSDRVRELCWDGFDSEVLNNLYREWYDEDDDRFGLAVWNGVRDYYCEPGGASLFEDEPQLTVLDLVQTFKDCALATPYWI